MSLPTINDLHANFTINRKEGLLLRDGRPVGAEDHGYLRVSLKGKRLYVHRVIWAMTHGSWPKGVIDHKNGNTKDNRLCNLRDIPRGENQRNRQLSSANSSGYNGVRFDKQTGKWRASIMFERKHICCGRHNTKCEAAKAVRKKAKELGFSARHGKPLATT